MLPFKKPSAIAPGLRPFFRDTEEGLFHDPRWQTATSKACKPSAIAPGLRPFFRDTEEGLFHDPRWGSTATSKAQTL